MDLKQSLITESIVKGIARSCYLENQSTISQEIYGKR